MYTKYDVILCYICISVNTWSIELRNNIIALACASETETKTQAASASQDTKQFDSGCKTIIHIVW